MYNIFVIYTFVIIITLSGCGLGSCPYCQDYYFLFSYLWRFRVQLHRFLFFS